ncbi:MAG: hypothetical protein KGZ61_12785 [Sandarakinorhabdus sp.]|nr:hypothetical protein [Sandarakinorhabdus sp.]
MRKVLIGAVLALLPVAAASAHHGWSAYDATLVLTVKAPLQALSWGNPHGSAKVKWQNAEWDVILAPVTRMEARGLSKDMVSNGQTVTLIGYPRADGSREMRIERVIVGDRTIELR